MPEVKVKRSQVAHFINTTPSATNPTYKRLGSGITTLSTNYNRSDTTEQYIDDDVGTTSVDSYAPTLPVEMSCIKGDPAFDYVDGLRKSLPTLSDAETDVIEVDLYETPDTAGTSYPARKWNVAVGFDTHGGDAGPAAQLGFTLLVNGSPVEGDFNASTLAFTADT